MARKVTVLECGGCGKKYEAYRNDSKWCHDCRGPAHKQRIAARETARYHPCATCGLPCARKALRCRACSNRERGERQRGPGSPTWKGGRTRHSDGYVELNIDGRKVLEHRYVWEQAYGPIPSNVHIHHANGDKTDNRLENLVATDARGHRHRERMVNPYEEKVRALEARISELEAELTSLRTTALLNQTVYDLPHKRDAG